MRLIYSAHGHLSLNSLNSVCIEASPCILHMRTRLEPWKSQEVEEPPLCFWLRRPLIETNIILQKVEIGHNLRNVLAYFCNPQLPGNHKSLHPCRNSPGYFELSQGSQKGFKHDSKRNLTFNSSNRSCFDQGKNTARHPADHWPEYFRGLPSLGAKAIAHGCGGKR